VDERHSRRVRPARRRREGDQAGPDAHQQRGLAAAGEGGPVHPLAAHPVSGKAPDRRGRTHLLLRPRPGLGRPVGARPGPHPRVRPARQARRAHPAHLGGLRLTGRELVDKPAPSQERSGKGASRGRCRRRGARLRRDTDRHDRHQGHGRPGVGPARDRGPVRAVRRRVQRRRAGRRARPPARARARLAALPVARPGAAAGPAARRLDRRDGRAALRRPARAVAGRLPPRVEAPEQRGRTRFMLRTREGR
jgi:hypothetical protein